MLNKYNTKLNNKYMHYNRLNIINNYYKIFTKNDKEWDFPISILKPFQSIGPSVRNVLFI